MTGRQREKIVLIGGGITFFLLLYLLVFLFPTIKKINLVEKQIQTDEKDTVQIRSLLEEYSSKNTETIKTFEGSLSAHVERTAQSIGVTIAFIRPYGEEGRGVEIKIDEMNGESILRFVYEMENSGIYISRLNMRDFKSTGVWVVTMNLES
jgi:type II secretory pathway component PulM